MKRNHAQRERPTALIKRSFLANGFDYASLEPDRRARVETAAQRIRELNRGMGEAAVGVGKLLIAVCEELGGPLFKIWLAAEFHYTERTAKYLIRIARQFGELDCLEKFDPSSLHELSRLRVPAPAVDEAIALARQGEYVSKARALSIVEKHERAAEIDPPPMPRRDEVHRLKSHLRVAIRRWPASERAQLARQLLTVIAEVLSEFGLDPQMAPEQPRPAAPAKQKPLRADVRSRAAAIGVAIG